MRIVATVVLTALVSGPALGQGSAPPAAATSPAAEGISRDDYIAKARAAAEKRAVKRFETMDADHDGILTRDEIVAYRAAHPRKKRTEQQQ